MFFVLLSICVSVLLLAVPHSVGAQRPQKPSTGRVEVTPDCGKESITVRIQFEGKYFSNGKFTDWIIVGDSGRDVCRLQGNGELQYIVQIAVFNDPCQTKMTAPGKFENTLRIAQFPGIILSDDLHFTFKCYYGRPEVAEFQLPQISPSFDVNRNLITSELTTSTPDSSDFDRPRGFNFDFTTPSDINDILQLNGLNKDDVSKSAEIARASSNLLAILLSAFLIIGVLVFLLILYICLRQWQGRKSSNRHDQIHTDSGTPSSTSPGIVNQDEDGSWWNTKTIQSGYMFGSSFKSKNYENRKKNLAPLPPYTAGSLNLEIERAVDVGNGTSQTTSAHAPGFHEAFRNGTSSDEHDNGKRVPQSYAEWREKVLRAKTTNARSPQHDPNLTLDRSGADQLDIASGCLTPVRSITEIYRSAETRLQKLIANQPDDNNSESSIEGEYSIPVQQLPLDKETRDRLANCTQKIRGFGGRRLTEQELGRWKQLINNDSHLQSRIMQARNLNELKEISELSEYRLFFTRTKWSQIMECVNECLSTLNQNSLDENSSTLNTRPFAKTERSNW